MPQTYQALIHTNGPALWPSHKSLAEVLELEETTPPSIWSSTYQGNPTPPEGSIFMREWWSGKNRFDAMESGLVNWVVGRWISWDTGLKDENDSAYTACVVGELWPDYLMAIREVWRARLQFTDLTEAIQNMANKYNRDGKLRAVIIEDKASGISALQTLAKSGLDKILVPFNPPADKEERANLAAVWCKNGCLQFPHPSPAVPWLIDFEDELFDFPGSAYKDQVDALTQLILWTENLLAEGWRARTGLVQ